MSRTSRLAVAVGLLGLAAAGSASAAVTMFSENFSSLSPTVNGFNTVTGFTTSSATYAVQGSYGHPGNVDIVHSGYFENLCGGGSACIDLDGTGTQNGQTRQDDYLFTTGAAGTFNFTAGNQYELKVNASLNNRNQTSDFIFGLLQANNDFNPVGAWSYKEVAAAGEPTGFKDYVWTFTLPTNVTDVTARLFFQNWTHQGASDNVGPVLQSITLTNLTAVPLPAAAWLLLSGLGGLGLVARRRRKDGMQAVAA